MRFFFLTSRWTIFTFASGVKISDLLAGAAKLEPNCLTGIETSLDMMATRVFIACAEVRQCVTELRFHIRIQK